MAATPNRNLTRSRTMTPAFRAALVHVDGKEKTPRGAKALIGAQLVLCVRNPWRLRDSLPPGRVPGGFGTGKKIGRRDETLPRGPGLSVTESGRAQSLGSREEGGARYETGPGRAAWADCGSRPTGRGEGGSWAPAGQRKKKERGRGWAFGPSAGRGLSLFLFLLYSEAI